MIEGSAGPQRTWSFHKRFRIHKNRTGCNSPVYARFHLTRKRPLLGRDSLGREQRETPGLVLEWFNRNREWGLLGRDCLDREQREFPSPVRIDWAVSGTWINGRKVTFNNFFNQNSPYISQISSICIFLPSQFSSKIDKKVHFIEVLFLFIIPKQHQEYLSAPSLDCLCPAEPTPCSC